VIRHDAPPENGGGRGGQIHAGIMAASGDVTAVVHADTIVSAPTFTRIVELLRKNPEISGGAVGSQFDDHRWRFRLLELANDFRTVLFGISFGDQVQFFRRKPVVQIDLFPAIPLMEDVEFSIRLHRLGRQTFLFGDALVSPRRWQTTGFKNSISIIYRTTTYLWKRLRGTPNTFSMYRDYYPD
jgi:GT2 family glycosyltransferase